MGLLPWPYVLARGVALHEIWKTPRAWSSAKIFETLQRKRCLTIDMLTKVIQQRLSKQSGNVVIRAVQSVAVRCGDFLFGMLQVDVDDITVCRTVAIAHRNITITGHITCLRARACHTSGGVKKKEAVCQHRGGEANKLRSGFCQVQ
jgi:hypothetical protein